MWAQCACHQMPGTVLKYSEQGLFGFGRWRMTYSPILPMRRAPPNLPARPSPFPPDFALCAFIN
jgi:hypothetical protein